MVVDGNAVTTVVGDEAGEGAVAVFDLYTAAVAVLDADQTQHDRARPLRMRTGLVEGEDRAAVAEFLQQHIGEVRAANEHSTWLENLTTALDYRTWHRFTMQ